MAGASSHVPVKVVHIDTQYVETDPLSFKSVVQSLTGMNSTVALMEESSSLPCHKRKRCGGSNGDDRSGGSNSQQPRNSKVFNGVASRGGLPVVSSDQKFF
ncbi:hypothetical protein RHMOL_Rhmol13G0145300 [Rhododendron molle]|uniref:Uncharacterized protein n=1 Tax=Rhododendron molle TaxID=49168 RepID=A0ACC0L6M9_RHOML|nr:hypothetical protein RHMOL_Rhmol13G0145300 [Rhododendron molle]